MANKEIKYSLKVLDKLAQKAMGAFASKVRETDTKFDRLRRQSDRTSKAIQKGINSSNLTLKVFLANLASQAFTKFIGSVRGLAGALFENTQAIETTTTQFEVLTGSASKANDIIQELQEFSASTPFQFSGIAKAGAQLLGFGFQANEIKDRLREIGDVASAANTPIEEIALIFGQVAAAGKLTGERLLQFQERAVPIGPAIAKTLGIAESQVKQFVSEGKVSFDTFLTAFQSLSKEGGSAFEGMIKQSKTLGGIISTLKDNFTLTTQILGKTLLPAFKALGITLLSLIQGFNQSITSMNNSGEAGKKLIGIISDLITAAGFAGEAFTGLRVVFDFLRASLNIVFGLIIKAVDGFVKLGAVVGEFVGLDVSGLKALSNDLKDVQDAANATTESFVKSGIETTNSFGKSIDASNALNETLKKNFAEQQALANQPLSGPQALPGAPEPEAPAELTKEQQKQIEQLQKLEERLALMREEQNIARTEQELLFADERIERLQEQIGTEQALQVASEAEALKRQGKNAEASLLIEQKLYQSKRQLKMNELAFEKFAAGEQLKIVDDSLGQIAQATAVGGKRMFKITQAIQKAQAITSGILSVQRAYESAPYPFNIVNALAQAVIAAGNVQRISSASPPAFEQGGIVPGNSFSGDRVIARVNSGEAILNKPQQKRLLDLASGTGGSDSASREIVVHTEVTLDGDVVAKAVSRRVADGLELGATA